MKNLNLIIVAVLLIAFPTNVMAYDVVSPPIFVKPILLAEAKDADYTREEVRALIKENKDLATSMEQKKRSMADQLHMFADNRDLMNLKQILDDCLNQVGDQEQNIEEQTAQLAALRRNLQRALELLDRDGAFNGAVSQQKNLLDKQNDQMFKKLRDMDALKRELKDTRNDLAQANARYDRLKKDYERRMKTASPDEMDDIKDEYAHKTRGLSFLNGVVGSRADKIAKLKRIIRDRDQRIVDLKRIIKNKDREIASLKKLLNDARKSVRPVRNHQSAEVRDLKKQLSAAHREASGLRDRLSSRERQHQKRTPAVHKKEIMKMDDDEDWTEAERPDHAVSASSGTYGGDYDDVIKEYEGKVDNANEDIAKELLNKYAGQARKTAEENAELAKQINALKDELSANAKEVADLKSELDKDNEAFKRIKEKGDAFKDKLKDQQDLISKLKDELANAVKPEEHQAQVEDLKKQLTTADGEADRIKKILARYEDIFKRLQEEEANHQRHMKDHFDGTQGQAQEENMDATTGPGQNMEQPVVLSPDSEKKTL